MRNMRVFLSHATNPGAVAVAPEVQKALNAWMTSTGTERTGVLIGGLALAFYCKPRYTQDVDMLFLSKSGIPSSVNGFNRNRPGAFEHKATGVEIELTTPVSFQPEIPEHLAAKVYATAEDYSGLKVASREGLIALKLFSAGIARRELGDLADVVSLLEGHTNITMCEWLLTEEQETRFRLCLSKHQ